MTVTSQSHGRTLHFKKGGWFYSDGQTPAGKVRTDCGFCGRNITPEGHDGCLGVLPESEVMNACCGHGDVRLAYVQFFNRPRISGQQALEWQRQHRDLKRIAKHGLFGNENRTSES